MFPWFHAMLLSTLKCLSNLKHSQGYLLCMIVFTTLLVFLAILILFGVMNLIWLQRTLQILLIKEDRPLRHIVWDHNWKYQLTPCSKLNEVCVVLDALPHRYALRLVHFFIFFMYLLPHFHVFTKSLIWVVFFTSHLTPVEVILCSSCVWFVFSPCRLCCIKFEDEFS